MLNNYNEKSEKLKKAYKRKPKHKNQEWDT